MLWKKLDVSLLKAELNSKMRLQQRRHAVLQGEFFQKIF